MLWIVKKGIRGGICNTIHQYAKANDKHMKDHDKNKESSYLKYWDVNKLQVNKSGWIFIKKYNDESDEGFFLEVDVQYTKKLHKLHNDLPILLERKKTKKIENLVTNLYEKNKYVIHIKNLKQVLNHGLILKKVHGVIKFNQKDWLKPYMAWIVN